MHRAEQAITLPDLSDATGWGNCISVVVVSHVVSHNEGDNLAHTVRSLLASLPAPPSTDLDGDYEIIIVDDESTDGSIETLTQLRGDGGDKHVIVLRPEQRLGSARARNFGARHAPLGWLAPMLDALAEPHVEAVGPAISGMQHPQCKGYGMRWCDAAFKTEWLGWHAQDSPDWAPYPVPIFGGCFIAMRRQVFDAVGGFDDDVMVWGMEDAELCLRMWTLGYQCLMVPGLEVAHLFRSTFPYQVNWEALLYNQPRVAVTHFGIERIQRVVERMVSNRAFPTAFAHLCASNVWNRRDRFRAARRFDDDWFFDRFGMHV